MIHRDGILTSLIVIIALAASIAAGTGIISSNGLEPDLTLERHQSVRGEEITLFGNGVYRHMSADVAVQGIGQDYVTLFLGVPLLIVFTYLSQRSPRRTAVEQTENQTKIGKQSIRARIVLMGILGYFFVTYLFYMLMGTYNILFLLYVLLTGTTFFALARMLLSTNAQDVTAAVSRECPTGIAGVFLVINALLIAFMWLGVVVPPLLDGSLYPDGLDHYTTLVVQGMDLSILLPLSLVIGMLLRRRTPLGVLLGPVYLVFLSILMCALSAKIVAMAATGVSVVPAIFIIPAITIVATLITIRLVKGYHE